MKNRLLVIFALVMNVASAQITINSADLPAAGDTFRLSITTPPAGADFTLTGPGYTWDFSQLNPQSQRVDTMLTLAATGQIFSGYFGFLYPSNLATKGSNLNIGAGGFGATGTDVFNFYNNVAASYSQTGIGATFNNLPIPIAFSPRDVVYSFPLNFGDLDTSRSVYSIDLSGSLGIYFKGKRTRINQVDGWGTITTPYGTRNALRVKTTVIESDSIHIDTIINIGLNLPTTTTIEYKWLAPGEGVPFLQANTNNNGTVNQVIYRDYRRSLISVEELDAASGIEVFPNPVHGTINIRSNSGKRVDLMLTLFDANGRLVRQQSGQTGSGSALRMELGDSVAPGNYILHLQSGTSRWVKTVFVE